MALVAAGGCGPGVPSLADPGEPLATLRAEVVTVAPLGTPTESLGAALVWAQVPESTEACLAAADTVDAVLDCTGGDVRPGLASVTVPVEPAFPSAFELPLFTLPPQDVLSGPTGARFGYGLVVVHHDGNQNGALDLVPPEETSGPDRSLGSTLRAGAGNEGDYLAFREGGLAPAWNLFRVLAGCPDPPQGYFLIRLSAGAGPAGWACTLASLEEPVTVELSDAPDVRARVCRHAEVPLSPPGGLPPADRAQVCLDAATLELIRGPGDSCPRVERRQLVGPGEPPAWDASEAPPPWWPCTSDDVPSLSLAASGAPLTSGRDALFSLAFLEGQGTYRLQDLRVVIEYAPGERLVLRGVDTLVIAGTVPIDFLDDADGNRRFSRGDRLQIWDEEGPLLDGTQAGPFPVQVQLWPEGGTPRDLGPPLVWVP